ncbi:MAG: hypothetical protein DRK00_07260 [Thermoprotei archaeon]|nr:MAG: hypothetical protein DRK00_07260 [Thermoprotei archaeon]
MRIDALVAAVAFALAVAVLLRSYAQAARLAYVGMARCWARAEQAASDIVAGREPKASVVVRLISRLGVREYTVGELRGGRSCYTYRILPNGTLLYVEARG